MTVPPIQRPNKGAGRNASAVEDEAIRRQVIDIRRRIHRHPELGNKEFKTSALVMETLRRARIPFRRYAPTAVVGVLKGKSGGPCVALRADMDALPLPEDVSWAHRSQTPGVMHACGHDAHTAMLLGAALRLARKADDLPGTVKFIFQPDEEGAGGAKRLIRQGVLDGPKVNAVFGLHVNPRLPAGALGIKPGPLMAAVDRFTVDIIGEGGHGAYPHEGRDAVVMAAQAVSALQHLVSRRSDPVDPVVLTVGTINGGHCFNILAEKVTLTGTVRTLNPATRRRMKEWMRDVFSGIAKAHGGRFRLTHEALSPALINDPAMAELAFTTARETAGPRAALRLAVPSMGAEDFSEYLARVPGCYVYLGTGGDAKTKRPWHHPSFFLHEDSMWSGVRYLSSLAEAALVRLNRNGRA